jgi:hypothetical protein
MSALGGHLVVEVTETNGKTREVTIPGKDIGLEDGGDWRREDDAWVCGFIFKAFCDGFEVQVSLGVVDDTPTGFSLSFGNFDNPVESVRVVEDVLDISQCFRSACASDH